MTAILKLISFSTGEVPTTNKELVALQLLRKLQDRLISNKEQGQRGAEASNQSQRPVLFKRHPQTEN